MPPLADLVEGVSPFNGRVYPAAKLSELIARNQLPQVCPAAFVLPLGIQAGPADAATGLFRQAISRLHGVVLVGPSRHVILGARGTAVLTFNAQGIPTARVTLTGLFTLPADAARPPLDLTKFQVPQVATKANTPGVTIDAVPFILRSFTLDLANDVQPRLLVGYEGIQIVDRNELLSMTVEAVPYATYNPFQKALTSARQAVVLQHGTIVGRRVRLDVARAVQRRPTGFEQNQNVVEWPLTFRPLPSSAGNDQWKLTLT